MRWHTFPLPFYSQEKAQWIQLPSQLSIPLSPRSMVTTVADEADNRFATADGIWDYMFLRRSVFSEMVPTLKNALRIGHINFIHFCELQP